MGSGELDPDLGPAEPHPSAGRDAGHRPRAAGRLQPRARHLQPRDRARDRRASCARRAAACPACARWGCRARASAPRSRSNVHDPTRCRSPQVVEEVARLAAEHGAGRSRRSWSGWCPEAALEGYPDEPPIRDFDPTRDVIEHVLRLALPARFRAMAQTKKKRRRKHRGTQGGRIDTRPARGRPRSRAEAQQRAQRAAGRRRRKRKPRRSRTGRSPPTWSSALKKGAVAGDPLRRCSLALIGQNPIGGASALAVVDARLLHPDGLLHGPLLLQPRLRKEAAEAAASARPAGPRRPAAEGSSSMDVRMFTVGQIAENCFLFRADGSDRALIVDPGDEAERILGAVDELGVTVDGDPAHPHPLRPHRRAWRRSRRRPGRPVWCPEIEAPVLADINSYVPWPGLRPLRELRGRPHRERRREARAGRLRDRRDLHPRPQPRPRHLLRSPTRRRSSRATSSSRARSAATDLPGGDWATLLESDPRRWSTPTRRRRRVYPGHMGVTTLGAERATNPFLAETRSLAGARLRLGRMSEKFKAPRGTFDVAARSSSRSRRRIEDAARRLLEARRLRPHRDAGLRGDRPVRARGRRVDRHRPEADVHLRRPGRALAHPAAGGDRLGLPRLPRARHAHAGAAGEALDRGALLPPRAPAGRPLPAVPPGRTPRRSARTRRWSTPS